MSWLDRLVGGVRKRAWQKAVSQAAALQWPNPIQSYVTALLPDPRLTDDPRLLGLDFETTGLDARSNKIISAGWVALDGQVIRGATAQHRMLDLEHVADREETVVIHGLTDHARESGDALSDVLAGLYHALQGRILLAHHAEIELGFLRAASLKAFGMAPPVLALDTLRLERLLRPDASSYRLLDCRAARGLPAYQNHHALSDAHATAELFLAQNAPRLGSRLGSALMISKAVTSANLQST